MAKGKKKLKEPLPIDRARDRTIYVELALDGYGTLDQMVQSAHHAIKELAIKRQSPVSGTLDDGTVITYNSKGNLVTDEEDESPS